MKLIEPGLKSNRDELRCKANKREGQVSSLIQLDILYIIFNLNVKIIILTVKVKFSRNPNKV